jgi:hypothetical protein
MKYLYPLLGYKKAIRIGLLLKKNLCGYIIDHHYLKRIYYFYLDYKQLANLGLFLKKALAYYLRNSYSFKAYFYYYITCN